MSLFCHSDGESVRKQSVLHLSIVMLVSHCFLCISQLGNILFVFDVLNRHFPKIESTN